MTIGQIKRAARTIQKEKGISYGRALEEAAKAAGYASWAAALREKEKAGAEKKPTVTSARIGPASRSEEDV